MHICPDIFSTLGPAHAAICVAQYDVVDVEHAKQAGPLRLFCCLFCKQYFLILAATCQSSTSKISDLLLLLYAEPDEEQPMAAAQLQRQQASSSDGQQDMQIEDVSLQDSQPNCDKGSDGKETGGTGVMQSVMGAAKSLFGGHANEVC